MLWGNQTHSARMATPDITAEAIRELRTMASSKIDFCRIYSY